jgi:hypothetical protein
MANHRIKWVNKQTGQSGHGDWLPAKEFKILCAWVEEVCKEYPEIEHFIETEKTDANHNHLP